MATMWSHPGCRGKQVDQAVPYTLGFREFSGQPRAAHRLNPQDTCRGSRALPATFVSERVGTMSQYRRIDVSKTGDVTLVRFQDKKILDESMIEEFGTELFGLIDLDNRKAILLNFEGVEFLGSAALGKLITLDRKVKGRQGRLKLSNICPEILEVFEVTKLNRVFDIRSSEEDALAAF
jgi:anti-sigma B factor antagonist